MSIVKRNQAQGALINILTQNPQVLSGLARQLGSYIGNYMNQPSRPVQRAKQVASQKPTLQSGGSFSGTKRNRRRRGRQSIIRQPSTQVVKLTFKDSWYIKNTLANTYTGYFQLACHMTAAVDFTTWLPAASNMSNSFRYFRIREIRYKLQSFLGMSSYGEIGIGYDPDPNVQLPSNVPAVYKHSASVVGDIKDGHSFTIRPSSFAGVSEECLTNGSLSVIDPKDSSFGIIQVATTNSEISGATVALLTYEVDVEFWSQF